MAGFRYTAVESSGRRVRAREEAVSEQVLRRALVDRGLLVLSVQTDVVPARRASAGFAQPRTALAVSRSLGSLLTAGVPLPRALRAARSSVPSAAADRLDLVRLRVERGERLHAAFAEVGGLLDSFGTGLIAAGESAGDLAGAFHRLTVHLERRAALRERLLSASIYPLLLACVGGAAVVVLLAFVLPRFVELLEGAGASVPRSTSMLLLAAEALRGSLPFAPVIAGFVAAGLVWAHRSGRGRRFIAALLLALPVIGALRRRYLAATFARLTATLLAGAAPLTGALAGTAGSMADPLGREEALRIRRRVQEGAALRAAFAESALFPEILAQLVSVGEEAGRLAEFLAKAAEMLEDELDTSLQRMVGLVEPAMIVAFGGVVGFIALSLLRAIYSVNAGPFQ